MRTLVAVSAAVLLCIGADAGYGKKPKPKKEEAPPASDTMQVQGTLGELDAGQVEQLFLHHQADLRRCYEEVAANLHYIGGRMETKIVVAPSGQPKSVSVVESSIGSVEVEHCVVGVISKLKFPAPKGGDGEVTYPFECAARTPVGNWNSQRVSGALEKKRAALKSCKGKLGATAAGLRATLYIGPGGRATSIGFATDAAFDEKLTSCVAKTILGLQYDDPLGQMVKVSYDLKELLGN